MYHAHARLVLSASDLSHFLSCRHLTALDLGAALDRHERPWQVVRPRLQRLIDRGREHEAAYVRRLRDRGLDVVDLNGIPLEESTRAIDATRKAMRRGDEIIVQGALQHESWFGFADVLRRVPVSSRLGTWSYEALDTKLARETRAGTILQLGLYTALLAELQGTVPERFHVVVPGDDDPSPVEIPYRTDDFAAFFRLLQSEFVAGIASGDQALADANYPEPNAFCDFCRWQRRCDGKWRADDHLSLVAGLGRLHRRELIERDFPTLTALAGMPTPVPFRPTRGSRETYERAREQALVQLESRGRATPVVKLRPPDPLPREGTIPDPRGFARLPKPSPGDLFLDLEGDRASEDGGHEYLFGIASTGADGAFEYEARWAFTRREERVAFEAVMDRITEALDRDPGMHVYHFAPYEPSAFKRLMGRHATREDALDRLLRDGRFVDLYGVVRQGLWIGVESYSIKRLEPCYGFEREVDLAHASSAMQALEYALPLRSADLVSSDDRAIVEGYNRDDCLSTLRLRDWLETVRADAVAAGREFPRPVPSTGEKSDRLTERDQAVLALRTRLLDAIPAGEGEATAPDESAHPNGLLAHLLDWHRREGKATWWEYYRLRSLPDEDLLDERQAIAGLEFVERIHHGTTTKAGRLRGPIIDRYRYPDQEVEIEAGKTLNTPDIGGWGTVARIDRAGSVMDVEKSLPRADVHPTTVFVFDFVRTDVIEQSLRRLGEAVADAGTVFALPPCAEADLLLRRPPRLRRGTFRQRTDESATDFAVRTALHLDRSVLAIQGPPGAGKTYTGAELICELVAQGKRVGVTANSHKVIRHLLDAVRDAAARKPLVVSVGHKDPTTSDETPEEDDVLRFASNQSAIAALASREVHVLGGTAWLWADDAAANGVDVLVVDEAGQMALANALAVAQAADSIVLLGDPQQLDQPVKAHHPDGVAVSALQYLLGDHPTMPEGRGIFLPTTWRLSPALCGFTSELYYERRLAPNDGLERQELVQAGELSGSHLHLIEVAHDGNRTTSPEEVDAIRRLVDRLTRDGVQWRNASGALASLQGEDILVVAPYNTHVNRIAEALEGTGVRVGTVDKFQGQEAPVVVCSLATSRPEDAPRGMEFLYSPNRLNVATSRARCAVFLVASPSLFRPECRTVRQMRLANGLCRFRELARGGEPRSQAGT